VGLEAFRFAVKHTLTVVAQTAVTAAMAETCGWSLIVIKHHS
jgi:hypothetical protein